MPTRRASSRVQVGGSRYSYGARVVPTAAPVKNATTSSSRSDPAYVAAQLRNIMTTRDHQALTDLQAGKLIPFIAYAQERVKHPLDDDDLARWTKLLADSQDKAEENAVAEGVATGEVTLETAQLFLKNHRDQYEASDPRYADLTQQIADNMNAIAARDFNAELNTAMTDMVEAGNTVAAKEKYLRTLIRVLPRAKDDKARQTIASQMVDLQDAIKTDRINARGAETSAKLVDYYDGKISGPEIMAHLREMAATALDDQEARAYATAASQVETRERTRARAAVARAASSSTAQAKGATDALAPLSKATKDAATLFSNSTKRSGLPDTEAYNTFKKAAQTELDAIEQALPTATPAAAAALVKRRDEILDDANTKSRAAATKTLQTERDRTAAFNASLDSLKKSKAPYEETAQLAYRRLETIKDAKALPWMVGFEEDPTLGGDLVGMERDTRKKLTDEAAISTGILTGETPTTGKVKAEYERYRKGFVGAGVDAPLGLDEWFSVMVNTKDVAAAKAKLGISTDDKTLRTEQDNVRMLWNDRHTEVQDAASRLSAASYPRDATGARVNYNTPLPGESSAAGPGGRPGYFDPTRGGQFDPNVFGPLTEAHRRGGAQQDYIMPTSPTAGTGVVPTSLSKGPGMAALAGDQPPTEDTNQQMIDAQRRARRAAMDPHDAADEFLRDTVPFIYPTWEIPALPDWGAFSGNALTSGTSEGDFYLPPPLPFQSQSNFQLPSIPSYSAPFNPQGPSFDPGTGYSPPPPPGAGAGAGSMGGGSAPMLTA